MIAIFTLLVALTFTFLITRIATVALTLTGMSRQSAQFQARSALTGCGFTTAETEALMDHPVRRRIIFMLMLLGNAGIVTVMATLMASVVAASGSDWTGWLLKFVLLVVGVAVLLFVANSQWIDRKLYPVIEWAVVKFGKVQACDYAALFRLADGYAIIEMMIEEGDWLAGRNLQELNLPAEGVLVLGVQRHSEYIGAPRGTTDVRVGDRLILYGVIERIEELDARKADRAGAAAHRAAVMEQQQREDEQREVASVGD